MSRSPSLTAARCARALLVLAVGLGVGCGLAPQPETDGIRIDDGVAPFADRGPLLFCVGTERLVSTLARQGSCRAETQVPTECGTDADCESPEACVCGLCRVQFCEITGDCRDGLVCAGSPRRCIPRCEADEDCGPYGVCNGGACETACWSQDDCPTGELCLVGRCAAIGCGENGPRCFEGETCEFQATAGVVLQADAIAADALTGVASDSNVALFAELQTPDVPSALLRFESADGRQFFADPGDASLPPVGYTRIGSPSVIATEQGLVIAVELDGGAAIAIARDPSGSGTGALTWEVALTPSGWTTATRAPALAEHDGTLVVAFAGDADEGIGLCVETDGSFTLPAAATLVPGDFELPDTFVGVSDLGGPELSFETSAAGRTIARLYAHARGTALPLGEGGEGGTLDVVNFSVVFAAGVLSDGESPADVAFRVAPSNPTFGRVQNFAPLEESDPSLVEDDGVTSLYYTGSTGLRVAENPVR